MKKTRVLSILFSIVFIGSLFTGCANGSSSDDKKDDKKKDTTETTEESNTPAAESRQGQLDAASAGATVTLDSSFADTELTVAKALTVDGNSISGLTVTVSSDVSSSVTLKNFKNAKIRVASVNGSNNNVNRINYSAGRIGYFNEGGERDPGKTDPARPDPIIPDPQDPADHDAELKNLGFDSVPLRLEGCTVDVIEAEAKLALYLENGEDRTTIDEIKLKEGSEEFTFIELDNKDTQLDDKSKVAKLSIEYEGDADERAKINLIGGTFDAVDLTDDYAGKGLDFKYDEEFAEHQLAFDETAFFANTKVEEKDVLIADNNEETLSGVWKIELDKSDIDKYFNGCVSIVFLNEKQMKILKGEEPYNELPIEAYTYELFNANNPIYCLTSMGDFQYDKVNTNELKTLSASESAIWTVGGYDEYGQPQFEQKTFQQYPNYPKESVIVKEGTRTEENEAGETETIKTITYYVNLDNIKKSDLLIGAEGDSAAIGGPGSKASYVELAGYKPYFAVDFGKFCDFWNSSDDVVHDIEPTADSHVNNGYEMWADGVWDEDNQRWAPYLYNGGSFYRHVTSDALRSSKAITEAGRVFYIPVYNTIQFEHGMPQFFFFEMTDASSEGYPDVSNVQYSEINVPTE